MTAVVSSLDRPGKIYCKAELLLEHLTKEIETIKRGLASLGARIEEEESTTQQP